MASSANTATNDANRLRRSARIIGTLSVGDEAPPFNIVWAAELDSPKERGVSTGFTHAIFHVEVFMEEPPGLHRAPVMG